MHLISIGLCDKKLASVGLGNYRKTSNCL